MAIPLPPIPQDRALAVDRPPPPSTPPTLQDISNAIRFLKALEVSSNIAVSNPATREDIAHAAIYQHRIIAAYIADQDDEMPAWAKRLSDKVDGLRERMEQLAASVHNSSSSE